MSNTTSHQPVRPAGKENYQELRKQVRTGDLLLFRGDYLLSRVIEKYSDSLYSHIAMLAWWDDRLLAFQADTRGVEVLPASKMVCRYNGQVDWWSRKTEIVLLPEFDLRLRNTALSLLGIKYGYLPLIKLGLRILLGRAIYRKDAHATPDSLFCSQFVSQCYREASRGHFDPVPSRNDASTSPGDFATSNHFESRVRLLDGSDGKACRSLLDSAKPDGAASLPRHQTPVWDGARLLNRDDSAA